MKKKVITLGEVMMRLSAPGSKRFLQTDSYEVVFGGAEANVAISLAHFGFEAIHVTAFPDHDIGKAAIAYLRQKGVDTSQVYFAEGRMGLYFLENGAMQRASKIIYDRFDSAFSKFRGKEINWDLMFEDADWFHWTGISPAISQEAADLCLAALKAAKSKGIMVSGDINYRRNLWQYGKSPLEIIPELIRYSHVLVAGLSDFENCMDIKAEDFEEACHLAKKDFPQIKYICKTKRKSISSNHNTLTGSLWNGKEILKSRTYDMPNIVDRVGGGDAYMAGMIYGLLHSPDQMAVDFATAASVLKHSIPGDANLVTVEEVRALVNDDNVGKLLR